MVFYNAHVSSNCIEHSINKCRTFWRTVLFCKFNRFIYWNNRGNVKHNFHLWNCDPHDHSVDSWYPFKIPVFQNCLYVFVQSILWMLNRTSKWKCKFLLLSGETKCEGFKIQSIRIPGTIFLAHGLWIPFPRKLHQPLNHGIRTYTELLILFRVLFYVKPRISLRNSPSD